MGRMRSLGPSPKPDIGVIGDKQTFRMPAKGGNGTLSALSRPLSDSRDIVLGE